MNLQIDPLGIAKALGNKTLSKAGMLALKKEEIAQARLKICNTCPSNSLVNGVCFQCTCLMSLKVYCMGCKCPDPKQFWKPEIVN